MWLERHVPRGTNLIATQGQQLRSAWFTTVSQPSHVPLEQLFATQGRIQAGPTVWSSFFWPVVPQVGWRQVPGPGSSPDTRFQFQGLSPYSNFFQIGVVPLTGQSIGTNTGTLSQQFGGQLVTSTAGTLTPGISIGLITSGQWTNSTGQLGPWINEKGVPTQAQALRSAWFDSVAGTPSWSPLKQRFDSVDLETAGPTVWGNFWWPVATTLGGWFYQAQLISSSTGTVLAFGQPFIGSPPAFVPTPGPGPGPFTNSVFQPQPFGTSFNIFQPLTGSALTSSTGNVAPVIDTILLVGQLISSTAGTVAPIVGNTAPLIGQEISTVAGSFIQVETDTFPITGQGMLLSTGAVTIFIPPGPGGDLSATIQAVIEAGLIPQVYYSFSPTIPAGFVISVTPPVGTLLPPNSPVVILASTGPGGSPGSSVVPNLIGLYWKDATDALEAADLSNDKYIWQVSSAPEGTVIAQSIAPGTNAVPGTIVQLTLSAGPVTVIPPVPVP